MAFTTAQVTLSTSGIVVVAQADNRNFVEVKNNDASIAVYVGNAASVTSSTGHKLAAGEAIVLTSPEAIFCVAASGTPVVSYIQVTR